MTLGSKLNVRGNKGRISVKVMFMQFCHLSLTNLSQKAGCWGPHTPNPKEWQELVLVAQCHGAAYRYLRHGPAPSSSETVEPASSDFSLSYRKMPDNNNFPKPRGSKLTLTTIHRRKGKMAAQAHLHGTHVALLWEKKPLPTSMTGSHSKERITNVCCMNC